MIVATLNKTKIRAVKDMFPGHKVESKTTDKFSDKKPEDMQVFVLAYNRVNHVGAKFSETVVSVEDGVFYDKGKYYISDICCIRDSGGYRFGYGYFLEISKTMRDYIRSGESRAVWIRWRVRRCLRPPSARQDVQPCCSRLRVCAADRRLRHPSFRSISALPSHRGRHRCLQGFPR